MDNLIWKKSTRSSPNGGHCIEIASKSADQILVRDSKSNAGPVLRLSAASWRTFIQKFCR
ncbi:DUF397 domain-containing protein [Catenuloplanes sp. NPDC051500]|uniref:DUF397 domain-containing protein n=1 Tax=Catenuloplanes sp. NPDC051500 TaxID=3363959 RepID=UPI0037AEB398